MGKKPANKDLKAMEERMLAAEKRSAELEKQLTVAKKKLKKKPKLISEPEKAPNATELTMHEVREGMQLQGAEHAKDWNRLLLLVRFLWAKYLPVNGTWSSYKGRRDAVIEAIAKEVPYFRRFEGLWPIRHIARQFLQNQDSKLRTALLDQECFEKDIERPVRRAGRKRKEKGGEVLSESVEEMEETEEMQDDGDDSEPERVKPKPKSAASSSKQPAKQPAKRRTKRDDSDESSSGSEEYTGAEDDSEESSDSEEEIEGGEEEEEVEVDGTEDGEEEVGKLNTAVWTPDVDDDKDEAPRKQVTQYASDTSLSSHEDYSFKQRKKPPQQGSSQKKIAKPDTKKPRKLTQCFLCDEQVPNMPSPQLDVLILKLEQSTVPAILPVLRREICSEITWMNGRDQAVDCALERGWPLLPNLDTIPQRVFDMREYLQNYLSDPESMDNDSCVAEFLTRIKFRVSDFDAAFRANKQHKLLDAIPHLEKAGYYGIPGYWTIHSSLTALVANCIPPDQIQLTLCGLAEDAERTDDPWQLDDGCIEPLSNETFISAILVAHVTLKLMEEDLNLIEDPRAVQKEFVQANLLSEYFARPLTLVHRNDLIADTSKKMKELFDNETIDTIEKPETKGKRKKEKTSVEDAKQMPKKKKAKTEEKENVDGSPRPKKKSSKPARSAPKPQQLTLDDFPPPPIKPARKKTTSSQKPPVASTSHSYGTRTRTKAIAA
ncbi:hypothetical protein C8F01DRAFT_1373897 [Mycena amicta]|nr:hypothetical protein C8F01DRAFT_1373897 [Mycena amicta]